MNIIVNGLMFSYNSAPVLNKVHLEAKSGEILSIVGPNGSGKSTMLKCLNRLLRPSEGSILLDGENIHDFDANALAKNIGMVPQSEGRPFPSTVFETILAGRKPHMKWRPSQGDKEKVASVINDLGLSSIALRDIHKLSGGQRQKVYIGRALAQEPQVLLLDEPTTSLDLKHQIEVLEMIRRLTSIGVTSIMAIHDLNLAATYSDKIVMLNKGTVVAAGGVEVLNPQTINEVYGVDVEIIKSRKRHIIVPI